MFGKSLFLLRQVQTKSSKMTNPLVNMSKYPKFGAIRAEDVVPAMQIHMKTFETAVANHEADVKTRLASKTLTWESMFLPIEVLRDQLERPWGVVNHMNNVKNTPELRKAIEEIQPQVVRLSDSFGQSAVLYEGYKHLSQNHSLEEAQKRVLESALLDAKLSGVGLEGAARDRFNEVSVELSKLTEKFSNNVLDATKQYALVLENADQVAGIPATVLELAVNAAKTRGHEQATSEKGPWVLTLEAPVFVPALQYCEDREVRKTLYEAYVGRASKDFTPMFDNDALIEKILDLRSEKASLLGYESFAEMSVATKMAQVPAKVFALIDELADVSVQKAKEELDTLSAFAKKNLAHHFKNDDNMKIMNWDASFVRDKLKKASFELDDEVLRAYFPLSKVLDGLFSLASRIYKIEIQEIKNLDASVYWVEEVRYFAVKDSCTHQIIGEFIVDMFSRPEEKNGGAWMDVLTQRSRQLKPDSEEVRIPIAYLVCNATPPNTTTNEESRLTFREVETLFHEFGHTLQHVLTTVDHAAVSGIANVEWDAVELPSQMMENWCYNAKVLSEISSHKQTGAALPIDLIEKIVAARCFMAATDMVRQLTFARADFDLHHEHSAAKKGQHHDVYKKVANKYAPIAPIENDRFLCAFTHIFSGGYSAGYYSYKWAEVLAQDAFSAFEEVSKDEYPVVGERFKNTVLSLGGSRHPSDVYRAFRGRDPSTQALLRTYNLLS